MLEEVFIPNEEKMNEIIDNIKLKFSFVDAIKTSITSFEDVISGVKPIPSLSINIGETKYTEARTVKIIDLSWYAPYKEIGDSVITGFVYVFFLWKLFIHLPGIISGVPGVVETNYAAQEIHAYNKYGFGRSSSLKPMQRGKPR